MKALVPTLMSLISLATPGIAETTDIQAALQSYGAAWASRDVDRIVNLHTEDSVFRLFVDGVPVARGQEEIAQQFSAILASNPTYQSRIENVRVGPGFAVLEYRIRMDADTAVHLGARTFAPTGETFEVDAIDVLEFDGGLVARKHTFVDVEALHNASPEVVVATQN